MTFRSRFLLLFCFLLAACGPSAEDNAASAVAASRASPSAPEPPPASVPASVPAAEPPELTVSGSVAASADTPLPSKPETEAAPVEPETPAEPTGYGTDGMHPVCEAYFQRARRCFARAPADRTALLQQSLAATRAELLSANADTCREISRQFDDMAQAMACEAGAEAETQENGSFR
ncbi:MAG: hypothetical protein Q4A62_08275 [Eikenella sp.]|nr:hypothetical protein [Eikenella sp.]